MKVSKKWKVEKALTRLNGCTTEIRDTKYAHDCIGKAIMVERCFNYSGSGPTAFGGARQWPFLRIGIAFKENDIAKRDEIAEKVKKFIDENM